MQARPTRDRLLPGLVHQVPTAPFLKAQAPRAPGHTDQARTDQARTGLAHTELASRAPARRRLPHSLPRRSRPAPTPPERTRQTLIARGRRELGRTPPDRPAMDRPATDQRLKDRPPLDRVATGRPALDRPDRARRAAFRLARFRGPAGRRHSLRGVPAPGRPVIRGLSLSLSPGSGPGGRNRVTAIRPRRAAAATPGRECLAREAPGKDRGQRLIHGIPVRARQALRLGDQPAQSGCSPPAPSTRRAARYQRTTPKGTLRVPRATPTRRAAMPDTVSRPAQGTELLLLLAQIPRVTPTPRARHTQPAPLTPASQVAPPVPVTSPVQAAGALLTTRRAPRTRRGCPPTRTKPITSTGARGGMAAGAATRRPSTVVPTRT